jgi:hypothetical protein
MDITGKEDKIAAILAEQTPLKPHYCAYLSKMIMKAIEPPVSGIAIPMGDLDSGQLPSGEGMDNAL